jgi:hypothetical protein
MRYLSLFALFVLPLPVLAADAPKVERFAPHAAGVALAEVVAVEKYDDRPADGNAGVRFKLKRIRGSGEFVEDIYAVTAYGGLRPPGAPEPASSAPVKPDSLKKGERYWFAFASQHEYEKYNQGIIGFWPEQDPKAEALEAAVKADAYRWHPQYDPQTKLTYGRIIERDKWLVRVEKDGKELWRKEIPGTKTSDYFSWGLWDNTGGDLVVSMPKCGKILIAETGRKVEKDNEFGINAGKYWINTGFDPETGKRLASWVRLPQVSHVAVVDRRYNPKTGKPQFEQRYDFPQAGGKAVGAPKEEWYRKIERTFGAEGKVTKEEVFRYDQAAEAGKRWVKVSK